MDYENIDFKQATTSFLNRVRVDLGVRRNLALNELMTLVSISFLEVGEENHFKSLTLYATKIGVLFDVQAQTEPSAWWVKNNGKELTVVSLLPYRLSGDLPLVGNLRFGPTLEQLNHPERASIEGDFLIATEVINILKERNGKYGVFNKDGLSEEEERSLAVQRESYVQRRTRELKGLGPEGAPTIPFSGRK